MENKKAIVACRVIAIFGIVIGFFMFVFGAVLSTESDTYYYNISQSHSSASNADAKIIDNTYAIAQLTSSLIGGISLIMVFGGLALMLGFTIKFASSYVTIKKKKVIKYVLQEDAEPQKTDDMEIIMEYLRKNIEKENEMGNSKNLD